MSNNRLELGGTSAVPAASSIMLEGALQEELDGDAQLQRQSRFRKAELQPLATTFPNRNQYTPPYTPGGSHAGSAAFPLGDAALAESEVEIHCPETQASKGNAHDAGARFLPNTAPPGQIDPSRTRKSNPIEHAIESQPKDWGVRQSHQRRSDTTPSVHESRSRTHSPARSLARGDSLVRETSSRHNYSHHSKHEVEYASYHHNNNHQPHYSPDRHPMRSPSPDPVRRQRGRSPSPKSLVDDHEQVSNPLDHDVSITRTNRVRSKSSSSSISGIDSGSRNQSRDVISTPVHPRRGYTPPRMSTHSQPQWARPASPHHEENETLPVTRAAGRTSLASRLKAFTPTMPQSEAEVPNTESPPTYRFRRTRLEDTGGRQAKRRLQDRIDGNQNNPRCPYSHRVNGANDCHDKNQPHPGYTDGEWRVVMEHVQRFGYAPPHLTKEGCIYHPDFKPPESLKPPNSSQRRNHPLNPFSIPPAAHGTEHYIPPQQPSTAISYLQTAPMPAPMQTPSFSSGPHPHGHSLRPAHMGTSHVNPFDTSGKFEGLPIPKKRRIGHQWQFRSAPGDHSSQQAQSGQWPHHSMPPNWNQQPPNNQPPAPIMRSSYPRQTHRPNAFHHQQGQPPIPPPLRRKRTHDQR